jgi:hypothetical protein
MARPRVAVPLLFAATCVGFAASLEVNLSRRRAIRQFGAAVASVGTTQQRASAEDNLPAEATFLVPTPLGILSYGLNKQAEEQKACYDAGDCLDKVPYYQLECSRDDVACLERKRRMGSKAVTEFFVNPLSSPAILVFSM